MGLGSKIKIVNDSNETFTIRITDIFGMRENANFSSIEGEVKPAAALPGTGENDWCYVEGSSIIAQGGCFTVGIRCGDSNEESSIRFGPTVLPGYKIEGSYESPRAKFVVKFESLEGYVVGILITIGDGYKLNPDKFSGFDGWKVAFNAEGRVESVFARNNQELRIPGIDCRLVDSICRHAEPPGSTKHLFVFVHGVDVSFDHYLDYIEWFRNLFDQYASHQASLRSEDIAILGVNWKSQEMGAMLASLFNPEGIMPAQRLAESGLSELLNDIGKRCPNMRVHLVGHSMGSQVLLYLLPKLSDVRVGSMMFLQGFAPSSAFGDAVQEKPKRETFMEAVRNQVKAWLRAAYPVINSVYSIDSKLNEYTSNVVKVTEFREHLHKVSGPIVATTTATLWADYQVGAAEASFYSPSGVLGVRGFVSDAVACPVHDVDEDEIECGKKNYDFSISDRQRFFNLRAEPYITDHDDFKNRAIAYAHLRAAGIFNDDVISEAKRVRTKRVVFASGPVPVTPDCWMAKTWETIKTRTLTQLCMPGSHDAGIGVVTNVRVPKADVISRIVSKVVKAKASSVLMKNDQFFELLTRGPIDLLTSTAIETARSLVPRLSVTQTVPIREQLHQGCRFFDLRPAWTSEGFYLAHGEHQSFDPGVGRNKEDLGYLGCVGESLDKVLKDVTAFAADPAHDKELIVLKFSHAANWEEPGSGFEAAQKQKLLALIRDKLRTAMIETLDSSKRIDGIPLEQMLAVAGRTVLCIYERAFDDAGLTDDQRKGMYWYGPTDENSHYNYGLYDSYANSRNQARIIGDQWSKYQKQMRARDPGGADDHVFLLSWTCTLNPSPAVMDLRSIIDHAQALNARLRPSMENWIARGDIRGAKRPNVIYVDAYDERTLDVVTMINALPL